MKISDLDFQYPEELVATSPVRPSRVMWVENSQPCEISIEELLSKFRAGDLLVLNDTKVLKRRVFAGQKEIEILFLSHLGDKRWEVLFPSKKFKLGEVLELPEGVQMRLEQKGRPQIVSLNKELGEDYFERVAELPLPPYIQKARQERHNIQADASWYQTAWAKKAGSFAAPTASLHFSDQQIAQLKSRGVRVEYVTLHVGLGTFLPVLTEELSDHKMHSEYVEIPNATLQAIEQTQFENAKIWALGTTVCRSLESLAVGKLSKSVDGVSGFTDLLIQPGFEFKVVQRLLTNFHQPQSTLLALVAGFADLKTVHLAYQWAINKKFRLFSYGDLSVWIKP